MTPEEELAEIRERAIWAWTTHTSGTDSNQAFLDRLYLLTLLDSLVAENAALRETLEHADLEIRHLHHALDNAEGDVVTAMGWKSSHDHSD